jgi:hypothetical protein
VEAEVRVKEKSARNVQSDMGSNVAFWVVDALASHPQLASLSTQVSSFSTVAKNADPRVDYRHTAEDATTENRYVRIRR